MEIITNEEILEKTNGLLSYEAIRKAQVIDIDYSEKEEKPKRKLFKKNKDVRKGITNRDLLQIVISLVLILILFKYVIISIRVDGSSMVPTFNNGERGVMLRTNPLNQPQRFDVIVFNGEKNYNEKELIVKRVIGLSDDMLEIKNNEIYINNEKIDDPYRNPNTMMSDYPLTVIPKDQYFVLGDNRNNSLDSRRVGLINKSEIVAVHGIMYWPLDRIGFMN